MKGEKTHKLFPPLQLVTKPLLETDEAAYYFNRSPQTLRAWACYQKNAPLLPVRMKRKLGWPTEEVRRLVQSGW